MNIRDVKMQHMAGLSDYVRSKLYREPELRNLFLELTLRCNEHCFHCGSSCTAEGSDELTLDQYKAILDQIKEDFYISRLLLCITGGEPLLRRDFFDIMGYAHALGYKWGMTSNATLITPDVARRLSECGMATISVSIDGLPETHDRLRGMKGAYDRAMEGIENLLAVGTFHAVQITTVVNHANASELDAMFDIFDKIDIDSWRIATLEPIGRALKRPELMCTAEDYIKVFEFIKDKRAAGYPLEYGCCHYLGPTYEAVVRDWYWLCNAGVYVGSIMANGDIGSCLDVERRPETIQGNILKDRFSDVWRDRFKIFRRDLSDLSESCKGCEHINYCRGDAHHSFDYDNNKPLVCMKDVLF